MDCRLVREHLDAYVDNELEPTPVIEFEGHLDACSGCRNELALWRLMRQGVRQQPLPPAAPRALRARVLDALDEADGKATTAQRRRHGMAVGTLGLAAAAVLALGVVINDQPAATAVTTSAGVSPEPQRLLRQIVAHHNDQLPTEIAPPQPETVTPWFRGKTTFRVRPVVFSEPRVRFVGARVSYINDQRAARLYYQVGDSRVTMMAFPADEALRRALHDGRRLQRTRVGSRVVAYDDFQNYTVPIFEHNGVVYAFTGDLDKASLLKLVGSAQVSP